LFAQTEQQRLGNTLDDRFYGRDTPHLDTLRAAFRALTREQLNLVIKRHLALDKLQIAIVAPDAQHLAKALTEDTPSPIRYSSEKPAQILEEDKLVEAYPLRLRDVELRIVPVTQMFY
jgi:zinc protease